VGKIHEAVVWRAIEAAEPPISKKYFRRDIFAAARPSTFGLAFRGFSG
jgi:hypothetical protein